MRPRAGGVHDGQEPFPSVELLPIHMPEAHAVRPFVADPGSPPLLAGLSCDFTVHSEGLMGSVIWYMNAQLGFDYAF